MNFTKKQSVKIACLLLGSIAGLASNYSAPSVFAQSLPSDTLPQETAFKPPEDDAPSRTVGGGSRPSSLGLCPQDLQKIDRPLTALLSAKEQSLTTASRPAFFVYLPQTQAKQISLTIKDDQEDYYYEAILPLSQQSGIIKIDLPEDAPNLATEKNYTWSVTIVCGKMKKPGDPYVSGTIERVEANIELQKRLESASLEEMANLYANNGIWYDALNAVARWKMAEPNSNLAVTNWKQLLQAVGLESIGSEKLFDLDN
jgi:hypothetical protein